MNNTTVTQKARGRTKAKFSFLMHLVLFATFGGIFYIINAPWTVSIMFGWGIVLLFHGLAMSITISNIFENMVQSEVDKKS